MVFGVIVFATLFGFVVGFCFCLWWNLEEDKERSHSHVSTLPNDVKDFFPETSDWFQLLEQFFFQRTRNKAGINEYASQQLRKEVSAVLSKINGIKRFEVRDFSLGESPPLLDCFQVVKVQKAAEADDEIEEVALQTNFSYFNGVSFVLSVSHVLGVADLSVALLQLSGPALFGFASRPCEHWYFSFKDEPAIDLKVKVRGQLLPFKRKIELLVSNGIRKGIRKMHVLPAVKPRFKPFFSSDVTLDRITRIKDEPFRPNFSVNFSKDKTKKTDLDGFESTSLEVIMDRISNLSLSFGPVQVEKIFATLSVDYQPLVPSIMALLPEEYPIGPVGRKSISEFLNFSFERRTFNEIYNFAESKEIENGAICYRLKVVSATFNQVDYDATSDFGGNRNAGLREGDIILSIDGVEIVSKHFADVYQLMQAQINNIDDRSNSAKDVLKVFAVRKDLAVQRCEPLVSGLQTLPDSDRTNARRVGSQSSDPAPEIKITDLGGSKPAEVEVNEKMALPRDVLPTQGLTLRRHSADAASTYSANDDNESCEIEKSMAAVLSVSSIDVSQPVADEFKSNTDYPIEPLTELKEATIHEGEIVAKKSDLEVQDGASSDLVSGLPDEKPLQLQLTNQTTVESVIDPVRSGESELSYQQSFNQHSGFFPAADIINCCNSLIRNKFSFDVQPNKTEFLNLTVWGVDTDTRWHYPLGNLSLPVGHILKMCSITSSFRASKTFYLSQSVLTSAAPASSSPLQLDSISLAAREKVLARCYGSVKFQFKVHSRVSSSQCVVPRRTKPQHPNERPPTSSFSSNPSQVNRPTATPRHGKRYFANLRGAASKSSASNPSAARSVTIGIADKLKPRIQHDSKIVATAVKTSIHATLPLLQNQPTAQQADTQNTVSGSQPLRVSRSFNTNENISASMYEGNKNGAGRQGGNGGAKLAGKIVQMKGNVKKISSDFLKEQNFMDRAKLSQQKMASKAKPFRQLFNRNKGSIASQPRNSGNPINKSQFVVPYPEEDDRLFSVENSRSRSSSDEKVKTSLGSSILEFVEYEEELGDEMEIISELDSSQVVSLVDAKENTNPPVVQSTAITDNEELTTEALESFVLENLIELNDEQGDHYEFYDENNDEADGYFQDDFGNGDQDAFNIEDTHRLALLGNGEQTILPEGFEEKIPVAAKILYPQKIDGEKENSDDERFFEDNLDHNEVIASDE